MTDNDKVKAFLKEFPDWLKLVIAVVSVFLAIIGSYYTVKAQVTLLEERHGQMKMRLDEISKTQKEMLEAQNKILISLERLQVRVDHLQSRKER